MTDTELVAHYSDCALHVTHPARLALERAAKKGLCTLEWLPRGAIRVRAPWPWPTRATHEHEPIVWP